MKSYLLLNGLLCLGKLATVIEGKSDICHSESQYVMVFFNVISSLHTAIEKVHLFFFLRVVLFYNLKFESFVSFLFFIF